MKSYVVTKNNLITLLRKLNKSRLLIAPVKNEFSDVFFLPVSDVKEIYFDYENAINSAKEYFFPDSECMFTFKDKSLDSIKIPPLKEDFIIFGLRPCDTRALGLLDKFFERNFKDNLYLERRKRSTLITVSCPNLWEECFCTSIGAGPVLEDGFDLGLIPLRDRFFLKVGTEKGASLLKGSKGFFKEASDAEGREVHGFKKRVKNEEPKFDLNKVYRKLKEDKVDPSLWQDTASRCQNCGLCLFICPTCSCFTVNDRETSLTSQGRVRQWDGCYFRGFTRMAGNQDSVTDREEMVKRKYMHKMLQQIDEFGFSGCTGCGRCNKACVGNVDWLSNLVKISNV